MGIFRRAGRGRHGDAEATAAETASGGEGTWLEPDEVEALFGSRDEGPTVAIDVQGTTAQGDGEGQDPAASAETAEQNSAGSAEQSQAEPSMHVAAHRPSNFTPVAVAASIAADAERFVAQFPYEASPVPEGALDFTRASLTHVENLLGVLHEAGRPLPERLQQSLAVYLLETARREFGGRYLRFVAPDPLVLLVGEPRAEVGICAMSRVAARVTEGPEQSIIPFYASIGPLIAEGAEITLR